MAAIDPGHGNNNKKKNFRLVDIHSPLICHLLIRPFSFHTFLLVQAGPGCYSGQALWIFFFFKMYIYLK